MRNIDTANNDAATSSRIFTKNYFLRLQNRMWSILRVQEKWIKLNCRACLECNGDSCTNPSPTIYINEVDDDDNNEQ
ncbi:hypothetical protein TNCV_3348241 [Trichonephila clavipes]|nr:hypothetical protein TNCV_3348241 [Trichonephila clavipes]